MNKIKDIFKNFFEAYVEMPTSVFCIILIICMMFGYCVLTYVEGCTTDLLYPILIKIVPLSAHLVYSISKAISMLLLICTFVIVLKLDKKSDNKNY